MPVKKISFDINTKLLKKVDEVTLIADRSRAYILNELIHLFIDDLGGFYMSSRRLKEALDGEYTPIGKAFELIQQKRGPGKGQKR